MSGARIDAVLHRPRLEHQLAAATRRRLAIVLGGAGYGKSTLVAAWLAGTEGVDSGWCQLDEGSRELHRLVRRTVRSVEPHVADLPFELGSAVGGATTDDTADGIARAEGLAAILCETMEVGLARPLVLVFDDLHELDGAEPSLRFVETIVRGAPRDLHVVLTSRQPVGFPIERLRGQGEVVEIPGDQLRFDRAEVAALLDRLDGGAAELSDAVLELTGGWPALARLVIENLRSVPASERPAALRRMADPEGPLLAYIAEEVLGHEAQRTIEVLRVACRFDLVSAELLAAVGVGDAARILEDLDRRAFFVEGRLEGGERSFVLHTLVRDFVRARLPLADDEARAIHGRAAAWLTSQGREPEALRQLVLAEDWPAVADVVARRGIRFTGIGAIDAVVDAARALPDAQQGPRIQVVLGDALLRRGDWDPALEALRQAAGDAAVLAPSVAWRIGLIQHERGDVDGAIATFARADLDQGDPDDRALVAAWRAIACWQQSDPEGCRTWATFALRIAEETGDERALACALAATGALAHLEADLHRSVESFRRAVAAAERERDVLLQVRFRTDLGYVLVFEGRYEEGLAALDEAVRAAGGLGHSSFLALALADRGQAHLGLGHLEEAGADFAASRELFQRIGSHWVAYSRFREANLHRLRGEGVVARAEYQDVMADAANIGGPWFLADAIVGLAATLVDDDPEEALRLLEQAIGEDTGAWGPASPVLGAARVALTAGRPDVAAVYADRAHRSADRSHDRPNLAGVLEIKAQLAADAATARALLDQAEALWDETNSPLGRARHELARARVLGGREGHAAASRAAAAFRTMGARRMADAAALLAGRLEAAVRPPVEIRSLGTFKVLRSGEAAGAGEWQSKKARDLLKVLISRRGRPATREQLCEILWPDEDPGPLLNRLSVALATVRSVLDPERRYPADHFVRADKGSVALDLGHTAVDVEAFLSAAARARGGQRARPDRDALAEVEALFAGDFLEEDPYEEWAVPLREEARATYVSVVRSLAEAAIADADADAAIRLYLRILEQDGYDEDAHLGLVRALAFHGRHGEARRRHGVYAARMEELGLEAAPYPATSTAAAARVVARRATLSRA